MAFAGDPKSLEQFIENLPIESDDDGRSFAVCGDMMIPLPEKPVPRQWGHLRVFRPNTGLWPKGIVPYVFHQNVSSAQRSLARQAMDYWEIGSPFRFVLRQAETTYLQIRNSTVNRSTVGRVQGVNNLQLRDWDLRTICHELGHVFGLWHEHQRPDRDSFIEIIPSAIDPQFSADGWKKITGGITRGGYDFGSVTHYEPDRGALPGRIAIRCRHPWQNQQAYIGQAQVPSAEDKRELEAYYRERGVLP